jgi:hypothetical protein
LRPTRILRTLTSNSPPPGVPDRAPVTKRYEIGRATLGRYHGQLVAAHLKA